MTLKNSLAGLALLLFVGGAGYITYDRYIVPSPQCEICGRAVIAEHEAVVQLNNGGKVHACCPRCALHYELNRPGRVAGLLVEDRTTGAKIGSEKAFYVEGSDDHSCVPASDTMPREPGVEYNRTYDRCLPSLVAFKDESAARRFAEVHGGRVLTYEQTVASVKQH